jgi:iron complex outermembrane receptor protein
LLIKHTHRSAQGEKLVARNTLRFGCSVAALAIAAGGGSAFAQADAPALTAAASAANSAPRSSPGDGATVEEIVVTAQKRAESLQNVPIAITAVNADMLASRGVAGTDGLTSVVPSLTLPRVFNAQTPFIRGIGTGNTSPGDESANAIYVDGVYRPSLPGGLFDFNSVQQVEVLKGPQGTLFGRNALGGVINILTKDPSQTPHLDFEVGYGNFDTVETSLYGTRGLTSNIAIDLSLYYRNQGDGYLTNVFDGKRVSAGGDFSARSKLVWDSPGGQTKVVVSVDYDQYHPDSGIAFGSFENSTLLGGTITHGFYHVDEKYDPKATTSQYGGSVTATQDFSWARIVSITSYRYVRPTIDLEQDATPLAFVKVHQITEQNTLTQELQLLSPKGSTISWAGGFYYYNDVTSQDPLLLSGAGIPLPFLAVVDTERTNSYSVYGQATAPIPSSLPILSNTNFTVGLRYTVDQRAISGSDFTSPAVFAPNGLVPRSTANKSASFPKLTYKFVLDHKFTQNIMAYASVSRGFKSGLFGTVTPTDPAVRPSTLDAYEIGLKSQLFDNRLRLNMSGFYYKYTDIQLNEVVTGVSKLINAAASTTKGFDLDAEAVITRRFRVQASLTYLDGTFDSFSNAPLFSPRVNAMGQPVGGDVLSAINARGFTTPFTPTVTASLGAQYDIPTELGTFHLAGSAAYNSGYDWNPDDRLKQPAYTLVNASIKWTSLDGRYDVRLWGSNLLSQKYYSYVTDSGVGDIGSAAAPLTFGGSVAVHF